MSIVLVGCPALVAGEDAASADTSWKIVARDKDLEIYGRVRRTRNSKQLARLTRRLVLWAL